MKDYVCLDDIPKNNKGKNDWEKSIGKKIKGICKSINYEFEILKYDKKKHLISLRDNNGNIYLKHSNCVIYNMFSFEVEYWTKKYRYEIGDKLLDDKKSLTIVNRYLKEEKGLKYVKSYDVKCCKCGFLNIGISEYDLNKNRTCCPCCSNKIVVDGINDIVTKEPWMIVYFPGGANEAKKYVPKSNKKIIMKCPDCGRLTSKPYSINNLYYKKHIGCICKDGYSYPEKFMYSVLQQIHVDFDFQWKPDWSKNKIYDFYLPDFRVVIETDGGIGHGNPSKYGEDPLVTKQIDEMKDNLAYEQGIKVVRINSLESNLSYMKSNILNSSLFKKLNVDENSIDWSECDLFATYNLLKKVCEYFQNNPTKLPREIKDDLNLKITSQTITEYLNRGTELGLCEYDGRKSLEKSLKKAWEHNVKKVACYSLDDKFLFVFNSISEAAKWCNGYTGNICQVCKGNKKTAYGYIWKYFEE